MKPRPRHSTAPHRTTWVSCACSHRAATGAMAWPAARRQDPQRLLMTEPAVASSDACIETTISRDGATTSSTAVGWTSGKWRPMVQDPHRGRTNRTQCLPTAVDGLVPIDTPGVTITAPFTWLARDRHGHCEIDYHNVRSRPPTCSAKRAADASTPGWGRAIHHCMRAGRGRTRLGTMVNRVRNRVAFGRPLQTGRRATWRLLSPATKSTRQGWLRCEKGGVDNRPTWQQRGAPPGRATRRWPLRVACDVIDRAIQVHGAAGVSDDTAGPVVRLAPRHAHLRRS